MNETENHRKNCEFSNIITSAVVAPFTLRRPISLVLLETRTEVTENNPRQIIIMARSEKKAERSAFLISFP
jgi:hypothetical protein